MDHSNANESFRSRLRDAFSGALGGVVGTLLLNMMIPQTEGLYLALIFVLPGFILGAIIGYFLGSKIGRGFTAILSGFTSFMAVLIGILLMVQD